MPDQYIVSLIIRFLQNFIYKRSKILQHKLVYLILTHIHKLILGFRYWIVFFWFFCQYKTHLQIFFRLL